MLRTLATPRAPWVGGLFRPIGGATAAAVREAQAAAARRALHLLPSCTTAARTRSNGAHPAWHPRAQPQSRRTFQSSAHRRSEDKGKSDGKDSGKGSDKGDSGKTSDEKLGFSARLKKMTREYGWTALGVYLGLSVLDFPFCFALVRVVGTEKIGRRPCPSSVEIKRHEANDEIVQQPQ
jgi:hypothetical protein